MENHQKILQVAVVGELQSGKSSLIDAILGKEFSPNYLATFTIENSKQRLFGRVLVRIIDTPGKNTNTFFNINLDCQQAQIFIVCVNLNQSSNLKRVDKYVTEIKKYNKNKPFILLVGTNADLESEKNITLNELAQKAEDLGCQSCFFTSAKEKTNIANLRTELCKLIEELNNKNATVARPASDSINKQKHIQKSSSFWQRHKHKIINGIIIGAFVTIAITLAIVLPVAPLLASIGLVIPFTGIALTATLAGIGATVGLVAGSVVAGIKFGIETMVNFFQRKEKIVDNANDTKKQTHHSKNKSHFLKPVIDPSNTLIKPKENPSLIFSNPLNIKSNKDEGQSYDRIASQTGALYGLSTGQ